MGDLDKLTEATKAIEGVVKAVPVYQDGLQPAVRQLGKGLEGAIKVALAPLNAVVWGYDKISVMLEEKLSEKLKRLPTERIITPNLLVAGPTVQALTFAAHEDTLRELYANLLATSIDSETAKNAHPGFVQIIQNMTPDEARILRIFATTGDQPLIDIIATRKDGKGFVIVHKNFSHIGKMSGCEYENLTPSYLDNLCRLGLVEIPTGLYLIEDALYTKLESDVEIIPLKQPFEEEHTVSFKRKKIELTNLGRQFCLSCVIDKNLQI